MQTLLSHETKLVTGAAAASRNDSSDSDSESNFRPASSQSNILLLVSIKIYLLNLSAIVYIETPHALPFKLDSHLSLF